MLAALLMLATASMAQAAPDTALTLFPEGPPKAWPNDTALWWKAAGDPVLNTLVERGLSTDKPLACEALALRKGEDKARSRGKRIDRQIVRLFDSSAAEAESAELRAKAYDYADRRAEISADIASLYLDLRRLQEIDGLRGKLQNQFKDNAEIARFRREAGLVDGLDVGLAGSLVAINGDGLERNRTVFDDKLRQLAAMTGLDEPTLRASLGEAGEVPDLAIPAIAAAPDGQSVAASSEAPARRADLLSFERRLVAIMLRQNVSQRSVSMALAEADTAGGNPSDVANTSDASSDKDTLARQSAARLRAAQTEIRKTLARERARLDATEQRLGTIEKKLREARASASSARVAYRNGMVPFAALYAAEAAGSGLAEAGVDARAARAAGEVSLARALGLGWTEDDLTPGTVGISGTEMLVCD